MIHHMFLLVSFQLVNSSEKVLFRQPVLVFVYILIRKAYDIRPLQVRSITSQLKPMASKAAIWPLSA